MLTFFCRGHGTKGRKIILRANYFSIVSAYEAQREEVVLHRYSITPKEALSKAKSHRLVEMILASDLLRGITWATDFRSIIVTTQKLDLGASAVYTNKVELIDDGDSPYPPPRESDPPHVKEARKRRTKHYDIQYTNTFRLSQLVDSLRSDTPGSFLATRGDIIQILNIIIAKQPNITPNVYSFSQNKFYPDQHALMEESDLQGGLRALRGYYASVRTSTHRILLNLNVSSAAFYHPIPLRNLMNVFLNSDKVPRPESELERLESFLRLLRVETKHLKARDANGKVKLGGNGQPITLRKSKTIMGFARHPPFGNAKDVKFALNNASNAQAAGRLVSVFDYYKEQHGVSLQHNKEPVLDVGSQKDPTYLPVEFAYVLPGQAVRRLLSGPQTATMITVAARAPNLNAESIAGAPGEPGKALLLMGLDSKAQANTVVCTAMSLFTLVQSC